MVARIKNYPQLLNDHRNEIGAKCPPAINTRWVYDYDILNFIIKHESKTKKYIVLSNEELKLFDILFVFKSLIGIFENPNTLFHRAFFYLERAIIAFDELKENGNPFAEGFKTSLMHYTLQSEEGGIWVLGYILTRQGQKDFCERIHKGNPTYSGEGLSYFQKRKEKGYTDPLNEVLDELMDDLEQNETSSPEQQNGTEEEQEPEEEDRDDIFRALQIAAFGRVDEEVIEEGKPSEEEEMNEMHVVDEKFTSVLDSAKKQLRTILINNELYSSRSVDVMMRLFNEYLEKDDPFVKEQTTDNVGFSWLQIKLSHPPYKGIAVVALKLLNSGVSEASCERNISTQKLIYNARRRHSNKSTLNARLLLMRTGTK